MEVRLTNNMEIYHILAIAALFPFLVAAGVKDDDSQLVQVPIEDSPVRALNNLTFQPVDLSKNRGCRGDNCRSAVSRDRNYYRTGGSGHGHRRSMRRDDFDDRSGEIDACDQPRYAGDCHRDRVRWYFNPRDGICREFVYSGCGGNANNFRSKRRCEQECNYYNDSVEDEY